MFDKGTWVVGGGRPIREFRKTRFLRDSRISPIFGPNFGATVGRFVSNQVAHCVRHVRIGRAGYLDGLYIPGKGVSGGAGLWQIYTNK